MSKVVGIRLAERRFADLQRVARATGRTPSDVAARLVEEGLRQREFPGLEFRDTPLGRQPFLAGTRVSVWHVALIAPEYSNIAEDIAASLGLPPSAIATALTYAAAYPEEIVAAIEDSDALNRRIAALVAARSSSGAT